MALRSLFHLLAAALAALALSSIGARASDAPPPMLIAPSVEITGDAITLGDLFHNAGEAHAATLSYAPAPGRSLTLDPSWLARAAAARGLAWTPPPGLTRVTVRRSSQTVSAEALAAAVAHALDPQTPEAWIVTLSGAAVFHAPTDALVEITIERLEHDAASGRISGQARLTLNGPTVRLAGRAERAIGAPVLNRAVSRGDVITARDLDWTRIPERRMRAGTVTSLDAITGLAARRPLRPGTPLVEADLTRPAVIEKGDVIRVVYRHGALVLTAQARALADAAQGEPVRIVNLSTNRTIDAIADGPGLARAEPAPRILAIGG